MNWRGLFAATVALVLSAAGAVAQVSMDGPRVDIPDRRPNPGVRVDLQDLVAGALALRDGYDRSRRGFICAQAYNDANANGRRDRGEAASPGGAFAISNVQGQTLAEGTPDANGRFCNDQPLASGLYTVRHMPAGGWRNTEPGGVAALKSVTLPPEKSGTVLFGDCRTDRCGEHDRETRSTAAATQPDSTVCVVKFNDLNGDGFRQPNEAYLTGWAFTLNWPNGSVSPMGSTGPGGALCFSGVMPPGVYSVTETGQTGWVQTTSAGAPQTFTLTPGATVTRLVGNRMVPTSTAKVCIVKYNDQDGDGVRDPGEPTLPGWLFAVRSTSGAMLAFGTTGPQGEWCSGANLPVGAVDLQETPKPGWVSTDPGNVPAGTSPSRTVTLSPGQTVHVVFGNRQPPPLAQVCVTKFEDLDGDGIVDPGEPFLSGWGFNVSAAGGVYSGTTDSNGNWCSPQALPPGTYTVSEQLQPGWYSTTPGGASQQFQINSQGAQANRTFGNWRVPPGQICVTKYRDDNHDHQPSAGEPPLPGWTFEVRNAAGTVVGSGVTDAHGRWCTSASPLPPGSYKVVETPKPGWSSTAPFGPLPWFRQVTLPPRGAQVWFGNVRSGSVCLTKYEDVNGNGSRDSGEPALAGWNFGLQGFGTPFGTLTTNAAGQACFADLVPGPYQIFELAVPSGWVATDPVPDYPGHSPTKFFDVVQGQTSQVQIGNHRLAGRLCVTKYADSDGDGVRDPGEPTLPGWSFTRQGAGSSQTDPTGPDGRICWTVPPGAWQVAEVAQPGWINTDPGGANPVRTAQVVDNQTVELSFGNRQTPPKPANLQISKSKLTPGSCHGSQPGADNCTFRLTVTNSGGVAYVGPLSISDTVDWYGQAFPVSVVTPPPGWACPSGPAAPIVCNVAAVTVAPGASVNFDITLNLNGPAPASRNCVVLTWSGGPPTPPACAQIFP
ncbi:MAG: hypothetical protein K1X35_00095 [Caulobacteraceae bacterium]|nr:hypothetical protein [Caulobacteraceae bacterium]